MKPRARWETDGHIHELHATDTMKTKTEQSRFAIKHHGKPMWVVPETVCAEIEKENEYFIHETGRLIDENAKLHLTIRQQIEGK